MEASAKPRIAPLPEKERRAYRVQIAVGRLCFAAVGTGAVIFIRAIRGNRFDGMARARQVYWEATESKRPTIVCANHLTMFDSVYMHYALGSIVSYLRDFRRLSWNVPAVENFKRDWFLRALTYVGKTVPIDRAGDPAHHRSVLDKIKTLVADGEIFTIFPEGRRSRTGRFEADRVAFGVGNILKAFDNPQVVCVYMRAESQTSHSLLPPRGDTIAIRVEVFEPHVEGIGLRAAKEAARQVAVKLKEMEDAYFAERANGIPVSSREGAVSAQNVS